MDSKEKEYNRRKSVENNSLVDRIIRNLMRKRNIFVLVYPLKRNKILSEEVDIEVNVLFQHHQLEIFTCLLSTKLYADHYQEYEYYYPGTLPTQKEFLISCNALY